MNVERSFHHMYARVIEGRAVPVSPSEREHLLSSLFYFHLIFHSYRPPPPLLVLPSTGLCSHVRRHLPPLCPQFLLIRHRTRCHPRRYHSWLSLAIALPGQ